MKVITLILFPVLLFAQSIELQWNANTDHVTGYKIYYGNDSFDYSDTINVGNITECKIDSLKIDNLYYFAATAYNESSESDYSNEISSIIGLMGDYDGSDIVDFEDLCYFVDVLFGVESNKGDYDNNGIVDFEDLCYFVDNLFGKGKI